MKDRKAVVAQNLIMLRKARGITQAELAERFNYSDKAVCRWEHGDTLPDINVLYALCDFYGITMNDLVNEDFTAEAAEQTEKDIRTYRNWACALLVAMVFFCATVFFIATMSLSARGYWLAFVWAVPLSCLIVHKCLRGNMGLLFKILLSSLFVWSFFAGCYLDVLVRYGANIWYLFIVGLPLQVCIMLWQKLKRLKTAEY